MNCKNDECVAIKSESGAIGGCLNVLAYEIHRYREQIEIVENILLSNIKSKDDVLRSMPITVTDKISCLTQDITEINDRLNCIRQLLNEQFGSDTKLI